MRMRVCMSVGDRIRLVYLRSSLVPFPQIVCWNSFISTPISCPWVGARCVWTATGSEEIRRRATSRTTSKHSKRNRAAPTLSSKLSISHLIWVTEAASMSVGCSHTLNLSDVSVPDGIQQLQTVSLMPISIAQIQVSRWTFGWKKPSYPVLLQGSDVTSVDLRRLTLCSDSNVTFNSQNKWIAAGFCAE